MLQRFQRIRETDMKKLLLITGILLSTSLWADMDKICYMFEEQGNTAQGTYDYIEDNCERNNIVNFSSFTQFNSDKLIARYCRHDREINLIERSRYDFDLVCVLYSPEGREEIK